MQLIVSILGRRGTIECIKNWSGVLQNWNGKLSEQSGALIPGATDFAMLNYREVVGAGYMDLFLLIYSCLRQIRSTRTSNSLILY
jgi:hypothetical protein